jgi:hypothetical protein
MKDILLLQEARSWLVSVLKLQQAVRPGEVNRTCQSFLSFVKTCSVTICWVTASVLRGSVILERSQLLFQTFGWKAISDKKAMEGRERKRALIHNINLIEGQRSIK